MTRSLMATSPTRSSPSPATSTDPELQRPERGRRVGHEHWTTTRAGITVSSDLGPGHDRERRDRHLHRRAQHPAHRRRDDRALLQRHDGGDRLDRPASPSPRPTGTWPQTVTVTGVDDSVDDGNIAYTIVTAPAISTDPNYSGLDAADVSVTNTRQRHVPGSPSLRPRDSSRPRAAARTPSPSS